MKLDWLKEDEVGELLQLEFANPRGMGMPIDQTVLKFLQYLKSPEDYEGPLSFVSNTGPGWRLGTHYFSVFLEIKTKPATFKDGKLKPSWEFVDEDSMGSF